MRGLERNVLVSRRSDAARWAAGALRAFGTIGFSALLVWITVAVFKDSGLLTRPAPAPEDSPVRSSPGPQSAYG